MMVAWDWGLAGQAQEEATRARAVWEERCRGHREGIGGAGAATRVEGLPRERERLERETSKRETVKVQFSEMVCFRVEGEGPGCVRERPWGPDGAAGASGR